MPWVGHVATRNRGTIGGSIANAYPAAEIPLVLVTLQGEVITQSPAGEATVNALSFFTGPMMTVLELGALVTATRWPVWTGGAVGIGFYEVSARRSDFAYVSAAAQVMLDADGACLRCAVGVGGAPPVPTRLDEACSALEGTMLNDAEIEAAVDPAVARLEVMSDSHATPSYRRRVARALAIRALIDARADAKQKLPGSPA
jgi:carbon-monoxide dehydrogenase medium subunit